MADQVEKLAEPEAKKSVRSYQRDIETEKQRMKAYSNKMASSVGSLQADIKSQKQENKAFSNKMVSSAMLLQADVRSLKNTFKQYSRDLKTAGANIRGEGIKDMSAKITKFKQEIKAQINENREAAKHISNAVKYFISEINSKKREFKSYSKGPFNDYIKAFWGISE